MPNLKVVYISQWQDGAKRYRSDCGPTCIAMLLDWAGKGGLSVDQLASETGLRINDTGLITPALVTLAQVHGLETHLHYPTSIKEICNEIDAGRPVVVLVKYAYLYNRQDQGFGDGHFLVITGYDGGDFICNDPDFFGTRTWQGFGVRYPMAQMDRAMTEIQASRQCLFVGPGPVSAPAPAPVWGTVTVTEDNLNVRLGPGTQYQSVRQLPAGAALEVIEVRGKWVKVEVPIYAWVSADYLKNTENK